jgi:hypothetical protein
MSAYNRKEQQMQATKHLTPREHMTLGVELADIEARVTRVLFVLCEAYGKAEGHRRADPVLKAIRALRSRMDDTVCAEIPFAVKEVEGVSVVGIYYGPRVQSEACPAGTQEARRWLSERA